MVKLVRFYTLVISTLVLLSGHALAQSIADSVVKVFTTVNPMDFYRPWQSQGVGNASGSGSIIHGDLILTNAHVVSDHTFIQVKKDGDPKKYTAKLKAISHECDLALLTVEDKDFFVGVTPISLGDLPVLQDSVVVLGYPQGGDKLSITEGVVSRIEVTSYSESGRKLLTVQIDAAINPGNSGGPVIKDGKLAGVAMQVFQSGQNIGYMIPTPVIQHFFDDIDDGAYDGFPLLGIEFTNTENKTLREYFKITDDTGGVIVSSILPYSPAKDILKEGDVVLEISDVAIGEDGTFPFRKNERLMLAHLVTDKQVGDPLKMRIKREGKYQTVTIPLTAFQPLIPNPKSFQKPPYYIYGGLVFTVLSVDLLESWGKRWWEKVPKDFSHYIIGSGRLNKDAKKEIIVLLHVLSDDINVGYHRDGNSVITEVNGKPFRSFEEFVKLTHENKDRKYTIFETLDQSKIIISNEKIDDINQSIIERNNIPYPFSEDVAGWLGVQR
ncbi:MAG: trypsin-like peptidase domain-containing protein [Candidatus Omnitrophica bacterium]|nr:trypsin-like peptidase domain-containing protein [Candidatus Omnitrophota bacterium]